MPPPQVTVPSSASAQRRQFAAAYSDPRAGGFGAGFSRRGLWRAREGRGAGAGWRWRLYLRSTNGGCERVHRLRPGQPHQGDRDHFHGHAPVPAGKLSLDQPLVQILPAFAQGEAAGGARHQVTLRMLLAHASGLPGYARLFAEARGPRGTARCLPPPAPRSPARKPCRVLRSWLHPARARAGSHCRREPGRLLLARGIHSPGHDQHLLSSTGWLAIRHPADRRGPTFRHRIIQGEVQDENCFVLGGVGGHAGLFSNALDPLLYAQCLLGQANSSRRRPFDSLPPAPACRLDSSRALGWDTPSQPSSSGRFFSRHSAGHLGYAGTSLWIDFERRLAIVLLTNRTWPHRQSQAIRTGSSGLSRRGHGSTGEITGQSSGSGTRLNCHNPKVFAWMARYALISEQSIVSWR